MEEMWSPVQVDAGLSWLVALLGLVLMWLAWKRRSR